MSFALIIVCIAVNVNYSDLKSSPVFHGGGQGKPLQKSTSSGSSDPSTEDRDVISDAEFSGDVISRPLPPATASLSEDSSTCSTVRVVDM